MINNKHLITPLLNFEKEGDFYMLYILKRKKDQPEGERDNHQSVRTIKTYAIDSLEFLEKRWDEIVHLSEHFKARVYIHIQKQNHKDVGLNMMVELANRLKDGASKFNNLFDSVVGQLKTYEKRWIIDIDNVAYPSPLMMAYINSSCKPLNTSKIISVIPTRNGFHLITKPFDVNDFVKYCKDTAQVIPDVQKKNPTLLYYPDTLN